MAMLKVEIELSGAAIEADAPHELARMFQKVAERFADLDKEFSHIGLHDSNGNRCGEVWLEED